MTQPTDTIYCSGCSYRLSVQDAPTCPNCGKHFNPECPLTYSNVPFDPTYFERRSRQHFVLYVALWAVVFVVVGFFVWAGVYAVLNW